MSPAKNSFGQPIGHPLPGWTPPPHPKPERLLGHSCRLEPVDPAEHAAALYAAYSAERDDAMWTYLPYGPFADSDAFRTWMELTCLGRDPLFFTIIDATTQVPVGLASYLRIDPRNGVIEVGHLLYSAAMRRSRVATEAMYLMMQHAFALGYRRYEWKCDSLNAPSRAAAQRLGFSYEGLFRQAIVVKGRNRDTAWYSIIDQEWPDVRAALERWLAPENFGPGGVQRVALSSLTAPILKSVR